MPWRLAIAWGVVAFVGVAVVKALGGSLWASAGAALLALGGFVAAAWWRAGRARRARGLDP